MGWDRHKLLWDGTDKYVPWTTLQNINSTHITLKGHISVVCKRNCLKLGKSLIAHQAF